MAKKPSTGPPSLHKVIMVGSGGVGKSAARINAYYYPTHKKENII